MIQTRGYQCATEAGMLEVEKVAGTHEGDPVVGTKFPMRALCKNRKRTKAFYNSCYIMDCSFS